MTVERVRERTDELPYPYLRDLVTGDSEGREPNQRYHRPVSVSSDLVRPPTREDQMTSLRTRPGSWVGETIASGGKYVTPGILGPSPRTIAPRPPVSPVNVDSHFTAYTLAGPTSSFRGDVDHESTDPSPGPTLGFEQTFSTVKRHSHTVGPHPDNE